MSLDFITNPASATIELSCYAQDLSIDENGKTNYLPENFLKDDNNLNTVFNKLFDNNNNSIKILETEKPYIQNSTSIEIDKTKDIIECVFKCCTNSTVDSIYDFSLYFSNPTILSLNDILKIEVYTHTTLLEEISREFLVCWNRLFHQSIPSSDKTFYLPIFLNRYKLNFYNCVETNNNPLYIKLTFKYNSSEIENSLYLYYKTKIFTNKMRTSLISTLKSKDYYYYYDRICDYSFSNSSNNSKWMNLISKNEGKLRKTIDLRFNEKYCRLSDLFVMIRNKNNTNSSTVVKSFSLFFEETCAFKLPAEICGTLISPVSHAQLNFKSISIFAPEITEVYYLPFSSNVELFKEYIPRSYLNTSGMANMALMIEFNDVAEVDKNINLDDYEVCLCYMSPVKMKC